MYGFCCSIYIGSTRISISALVGPTMAMRTLRFQYRRQGALWGFNIGSIGHSVTRSLEVTAPDSHKHKCQRTYIQFSMFTKVMYWRTHTHTYIYIHIQMYTSSTAQGGGGSFKNRKLIGDVGCCESRMAERSHWWTDRSLSLSLSFSDYLPIYLSSYLAIYLSIWSNLI